MPILAAVSKLHGAGSGEDRRVPNKWLVKAKLDDVWLLGVCVSPATSDCVRPVVIRISPG